MSYSITFSNNKVEKHSIVVTSNVYLALVLLKLFFNINGLVFILEYIQTSHVILFSVLNVVVLISRFTKDAGH